MGIEVNAADAVINAAAYRAYRHIQDATAGFVEAIGKGQLSTLALREMQHIPVELTYNDEKYSFVATPVARDAMLLSLGEQKIKIKYREQADGSLLVVYGAESHQLYAKEEPMGLRMVLDGMTVLLPTLYDPSELRSDVTGKLVRYLVPDGAKVKEGDAYAEAEAMKMIIQIKSSASGTIKHELNPGSILNQGDLISSMALDDPSKVKKILPFSGVLAYKKEEAGSTTALKAYRSSLAALQRVMDGCAARPDGCRRVPFPHRLQPTGPLAITHQTPNPNPNAPGTFPESSLNLP